MDGHGSFRDCTQYGAFFGFVFKSILLAWAIGALWLGIGTAIERGDVVSVFAGVGLGLVFGAPYGIFVLVVVATIGWGVWRICMALGAPLWSAVSAVSLLGALAVAFALSRLALAAGFPEPVLMIDRLTYILWLAARIVIVSVPIGLLAAWRTYGRLR